MKDEIRRLGKDWIEKTYVWFDIKESPRIGWELDFPVTRKNLMVMTSMFFEFSSTKDALTYIARLYDIVNTPRSARARKAWSKDLKEIGL